MPAGTTKDENIEFWRRGSGPATLGAGSSYFSVGRWTVGITNCASRKREHACQILRSEQSTPAAKFDQELVTDGSRSRAVLRAGRPQEDGGGLRDHAREPPGAELRDHDPGLAGAGRVAGGRGRHPRGHGEHRRLLE